MSFAQGFAQGFNMVDSALQRRNIQMLEEDRIAKEERRYNEQASRQKERDARSDMQADRAYSLQVDSANTQKEHFDKTFGLQEKQTNAAIEHQKAQERNAAAQLGISAMNARSNAARDAAAIENYKVQTRMHQLQLDQARQEAERQASFELIKPMMVTDEKTGVTTITFSEDRDFAKKQMDALSRYTGLDVKKFYKDPVAISGHVNQIKSALIDPQHWSKNKQQVIDSLNYLESMDINKGLGPYDGSNPQLQGGKIVSKKINDIYPSPDGKGFVFNVETVVEKDGKRYTDAGPMTQYRSSNPADNQIRLVTPDQIIKRLEGIEALGKTLELNPQQVNYINSHVYGGDIKTAKAKAELEQTQLENDAKRQELEYIKAHGVKMGTSGQDKQNVTISTNQYGGSNILNKDDGTLTVTTPNGKIISTTKIPGVGAASQAPQAVDAQSKNTIKVGQEGVVNGIPAVWDGKGWVRKDSN